MSCRLVNPAQVSLWLQYVPSAGDSVGAGKVQFANAGCVRAAFSHYLSVLNVPVGTTTATGRVAIWPSGLKSRAGSCPGSLVVRGRVTSIWEFMNGRMLPSAGAVLTKRASIAPPAPGRASSSELPWALAPTRWPARRRPARSKAS